MAVLAFLASAGRSAATDMPTETSEVTMRTASRFNPARAALTILLSLLATALTLSPARPAAAVSAVNCPAFVVTGNPHSTMGANWTYRSTDAGVRYALEGILFVPAGTGPFPAVLISHGKGGTPR